MEIVFQRQEESFSVRRARVNAVPEFDGKDRGIFPQRLCQHDKSMRKHGHRGEDGGGRGG